MIYEIRDLINSISELESEIEDLGAGLESKFAPSDWEIRRPAELRHKVTKRKIKLIKKMKKYLKENKIHVEVYHVND